jgi:hypothetical protein
MNIFAYNNVALPNDESRLDIGSACDVVQDREGFYSHVVESGPIARRGIVLLFGELLIVFNRIFLRELGLERGPLSLVIG